LPTPPQQPQPSDVVTSKEATEREITEKAALCNKDAAKAPSQAAVKPAAAPCDIQTKAEPAAAAAACDDKGRKPEVPTPAAAEVKSEPVVPPNNSQPNSSAGSGKKGQLWALPILPKPPQKPQEKRSNSLGGLGKKVADLAAAASGEVCAASNAAAAMPSASRCPFYKTLVSTETLLAKFFGQDPIQRLMDLQKLAKVFLLGRKKCF
jgi:hypothetical protein